MPQFVKTCRRKDCSDTERLVGDIGRGTQTAIEDTEKNIVLSLVKKTANIIFCIEMKFLRNNINSIRLFQKDSMKETEDIIGGTERKDCFMIKRDVHREIVNT
jgi:hypothetical protein